LNHGVGVPSRAALGLTGDGQLPNWEMMMVSKNCNTGLDDRCRDKDGTIRQKNGATRVATLRETYGPDFASDRRGDMKLDTLLEQTGAKSLSDYLRRRD